MSAATLQVACFRVAGFDCAVDIMTISEVLGPVEVVRLPTAPGFIEGMIEVRGRFLPVIDLRQRLASTAAAEGVSEDGPPRARAGGSASPHAGGATGAAAGKLLVAPLAGTRVALRVDEVTGVERIPSEEIQPPPALAGAPAASALVAGVARWNQRVLLVLDLAAVLSPGEQSALAGLAAEPA